ncbi:hypothetical protein LTR99_002880 [Exophiala xenobiotica]|uniref:Uncharacterized protein n=1 Tax=Vermiconidia calcicola TaxID=1690605 RepID=A0AAV9QAQ2_9PEZI|nr:hypothetical protein LTR99_002880 [Exophiala xenobiotica]KAK5432211.1 hypothetical protein LTR34_005332 [Exophiala xenobiotica]KAK5438335.1 hypothetical protein LTR18_008857 [Exophiala xenobiotica]KAK5538550.1 hypothetical protein LTR25_004092 [Vermiconidia calcicola]KAK5547961.1 hypothetical protein LTR23_002210 [Chaetothyriales sp. CCFEE 6169]
MSICPDNTTECLLRALVTEVNASRALLQDLLDATTKFNWDPLNFAFTAAIGALALLIACITVFQGLLAAGPGRIKASKVAVGPYAKSSSSRFDFTEFSLRTVVFVPSIGSENRIHRVNKDSPDHACCSKFDPSAGKSESSASWLRLLVELGISRPCLWSLVARQTDSLPVDISAAPAAGSVRFLSHLAAIADDNCIVEQRPGSRFVTVVGKSSQLTFRDHPVLGSVAMYEIYRETPHYRGGHSKKSGADHRPVTGIRGLHSVGVMETAGMLDLSHGLLKCRYLGYAVTEGLMELNFGVLLQKLTSHCTHQHLNDHPLSILFRGRGSYGARRAHGYIHFLLFFTSVPSLVRAFPSKLLRLRTAMHTIAHLIPAWRKSPAEVITEISGVVRTYGGTFLEIPMDAYVFYLLGARARHHSSSSWIEDPPGAGWCTNSMHSDFRETENDLVYGAEIIRSCCEWVKAPITDERKLGKLLMDDVKQFKDKLLASLYLVDDWLRRRNKEDTICAALLMIQEATVERPVQPVLYSPAPRSDIPEAVDHSGLRDLKVMMSYRAILLGALLELSTDTSCIVDEAFQDTIVKIL